MAYPSLLFIHGAANAAWVWDVWRRFLKPLGWDTNVLDLRGHGRSLPIDFNTVTMESYVEDVESVTAQIEAQGRHPVLCGWSMGGLVSMMYAAKHAETPAVVLLSPSPPVEVGGSLPASERRRTPAGPYGPEIYGIDPDNLESSRAALPDLTDEEARAVVRNSAGAQESGIARHQRQRGISLPQGAIACPALVVYGLEDGHFAPDQNRRLAEHLRGDVLELPGAGHWGIVYHSETVADAAWRVDSWLRRSVSR